MPKGNSGKKDKSQKRKKDSKGMKMLSSITSKTKHPMSFTEWVRERGFLPEALDEVTGIGLCIESALQLVSFLIGGRIARCPIHGNE